MLIDPTRSLKINRSRPTIGVIAGWQAYTGTLSSFLDRVFQGILASVSDRDCNVLLGCGTGLPYGVGFGKPAWPMVSPDVSFVPVGPWNCDGLIVLNPIGYASQVEFLEQLVKSRYPVVFTARIPDAAVMTIDNYDGIRQAVDHLVAHGHRRIAYISGRQGRLDSDSQNRWQAYRDSIQHHGIAYDQNLVAAGSHTFDGGQQAIGQNFK